MVIAYGRGMQRGWLRIAHRGASGTCPEHTRAAFARAIELGADLIELDVRLTRDRELVVIHDADLARTTNGHGPVRDADLASLRRLDAGSWFDRRFAGESMLTLDDVFDLVGRRAALNVEVKNDVADATEFVSTLLASLRRHDALASAIVSCFELPMLESLRAESRDLRLGVLWQDLDLCLAWAWARRFGAFSIHPHWGLVSPSMVNRAHHDGLQVFAWTVNEVPVMEQLVAAGVDGIMSDFPERFAAVRDAPVPQRR